MRKPGLHCLRRQTFISHDHYKDTSQNSFPSEEELRPKVNLEMGVDLSLMEVTLAMSVEERWQANQSAISLIQELSNT